MLDNRLTRTWLPRDRFAARSQFVMVNFDGRPLRVRTNDLPRSHELQGAMPVQFGGPVHRYFDAATDRQLRAGCEFNSAPAEIQRRAAPIQMP
jgi:hypothetical protein